MWSISISSRTKNHRQQLIAFSPKLPHYFQNLDLTKRTQLLKT